MKKNYVFIVILGLILGLGVLLRTINVIDTTNVFSDTGRDLLIGKKLVEGNAPIMVRPHSSAGANNTPLYFWIIGIIWKLTGTVEGSVVLHALLNSIMPIIVFFMGKSLFNKNFGLLAAFYFAIQPYFVISSRWIWQPHLLSIFIPLTIFSFIKYLSNLKQNKIFLITFFTSANLAIHLHFSSLPIIIFLMIILTYKTFINKKYFLITSFASLSSIILRIRTGFNYNSDSASASILNFITFNFEIIKNNFLVIKNSFAESFFLEFYMEPKIILLIFSLLFLTSYCLWI